MKREKVTFTSRHGHALSAYLELPPDGQAAYFAVYAHCFTCSKNLTAIRTLSAALTTTGFGVLSFDFTGLGESEGSFSGSSFSSNVTDIEDACAFLAKNYRAPGLLIGHSLGGTAALLAAYVIDSVQAVATIGAPANPEHVKRIIRANADASSASGEEFVADLGTGKFVVSAQFMKDLETHDLKSSLASLRKALLVLHAPQDRVVDISHAAEIFTAAHHPKSFVSLDGADHMMSRKEDSGYCGRMIGCWATRYLTPAPVEQRQEEFETVVRIGDSVDRFKVEIAAGKHNLVADEPVEVGGNDLGPSPYQLLSAALGACTAMTMRMYADRKQWDVREIQVHLNHAKKYSEDCMDCEKESSRIDHFERVLEVEGNLDDAQLNKLLEIANKCPVHRTLEGEIRIDTALKKKD